MNFTEKELSTILEALQCAYLGSSTTVDYFELICKVERALPAKSYLDADYR